MNDLFKPMVFCDVETTALGPGADLLEIAVAVTDSDLQVQGSPVSIVLPATDMRLEAMEPVVKQMHRRSGLWELCRMASGTLAEAEERIMAYVSAWMPPRGAPMCGSTIWFDRRLLERLTPRFEAFCHYRTIDVSSVKELAQRWNPGVYAGLPAREQTHRALPDIYNSIDELAYYRKRFLRTTTGSPTV